MPKKFSELFVLLLITFAAPLASAASSCGALIGQCGYYQCKSEELSCTDVDYFKLFGQHYCEAFDRETEKFSEHGLEVLARIKSCLQNKLESEPSLTCENALEYAYGHHEDCYLESGFCEMRFADKWLILWTVFPELDRSGFRDVVMNVSAGCLRQ